MQFDFDSKLLGLAIKEKTIGGLGVKNVQRQCIVFLFFQSPSITYKNRSFFEESWISKWIA